MKFHPQGEFFNNGFICPNETNEQYHNRLLHIAAKLNVATAREKPAFICLQACPEVLASRDTFVKALKKGELHDYAVNFYNNDDDEYYLMTLHDERQYSVVPQLSNLMAKIALTEGLQGRVLPLVFASHKTGEPWLVVNVHANFSKEVRHDVSALYQGATRLGIMNVVLLGDFNRDLVLESDNYSKHDISQALSEDYYFEDGLRVRATHGASFCTQYKKDSGQKKQRLETRDGVMSTCKLYVAPMAKINEADLSLSFIKEISSHLATIPDRFLEKLSSESNTGDRDGG
jgi:endonuclease/exonuclease/phosphatase family metal-dependent hydrolase